MVHQNINSFIFLLFYLLIFTTFTQSHPNVSNKFFKQVDLAEVKRYSIHYKKNSSTRDFLISKIRTIDNNQIKLSLYKDIRDIISSNFGIRQDRISREIIINGIHNGLGYIIDGIRVNDPLTNNLLIRINKNTIEELKLTQSFFNAEYGNATSGIVDIQLLSGYDNYFINTEFQSDEFLGNGIKYLRNSGSSIWNLSLGGPLIPNNNLLQFSGSLEYSFESDPYQSYYSEQIRNIANTIWPKFQFYTLNFIQRLTYQPIFSENEIGSPAYQTRIKELLLEQSNLNYVRPGQLPDASRRIFNWNEKVTLNLDNFKLTLAGISSRINSRLINPSYMLMNSFHNPLQKDIYDFYSIKANWTLPTITSIDAQIVYHHSLSKIMDPVHENRIFDYGDIDKNPLFKNYQLIPSMEKNIPKDFYFDYFALPGRVFNYYRSDKITFWQFNTCITHRIGNHEIKIGGEYGVYYLRKYSISPIRLSLLPDSIKNIIKVNPDLLDSAQLENVYYEYANALVNTYGYDYFEREVNSSGYNKIKRADGPKKPIYSAFYLQDKVKVEKFEFNAGIRLDYWNVNTNILKDLYDVSNSKNTQKWGTVDNYILNNPGKPVPQDGWGNPNTIDDDSFKKSIGILLSNPRIGISYLFSDKARGFVHYGKFSQLPQFSLLYYSQSWLSEWYKRPGYALLNNPSLAPIKLDQFEVGFNMNLSDYLTMRFTGYYQIVKGGQIYLKFIISEYNKSTFHIFNNEGRQFIKGLDYELYLKKWKNISALLFYNFNVSSIWNMTSPTLWIDPDLHPDYKLVTNCVNTLGANIDYRFENINNPLLDKLGIKLLMRANSGRFYDFDEVQYDLSFNTKWTINIQFDIKIDKTFEIGRNNLKLNTYILCLNLLNRKNIDNEFINPNLKYKVDNYFGISPRGFYEVIRHLSSLGRTSEIPIVQGLYEIGKSQLFNAGIPRQLRLGVMLEF